MLLKPHIFLHPSLRALPLQLLVLAIKNESVCFDCFPRSNHCTDCQRDAPWVLSRCQLASISDLGSVLRSEVCRLSRMIFAWFWSWFRAIQKWQPCWGVQNEQHDMTDTVMKRGIRVERRNCWLAISHNGGCRLLLQLFPYLGSSAKTFRCVNQDVSSAAIRKSDALF